MSKGYDAVRPATLQPEFVEGYGYVLLNARQYLVGPGAGIVDSEDPVWVEYARSIAPLAAPDAEFIAQLVAENSGGPLRVLDIAAGHGLFGIAIARRNALAEIVAVDWPNVLQVALENARAAGVDGRYRLLPGDAWAVEFGTGFDVVLVTHLLHSFAPPACEALMKKIMPA